MTGPSPTAERRPGRPRDVRTDDAIMEAAVAVLADRGPSGFTVDEVAARAGCGKATIYRRWSSRAALLFETATRMGLEPVAVDTGAVRSDMIAMLVQLAHKMRSTPAGRILPGVMSEACSDPAMRTVLASFIADHRQRPREVLERGVARGELPPDTDVELMLDMLGGPVMYRELIAQRETDDETIEALVDRVLAAFRARGPAPPT